MEKFETAEMIRMKQAHDRFVTSKMDMSGEPDCDEDGQPIWEASNKKT